MKTDKPRILVLTSLSPGTGAGVVAEDHYRFFREAGYDVDFMSPFPVKGHPEYKYVYSKRICHSLSLTHLLRKLTDKNGLLKRWRRWIPSYSFSYRRETNPMMSVRKIVDSITEPYDLVYVVFWQGMLTFQTIEAIYDKLHCQMFFYCIDYSPMSGGCHFTGDCDNFETGCGFCKGIGSRKLEDFTRWNVRYRRRVYDKVRPVVMGNSYMHTFFDRSWLLKDYDRKLKCSFTLDLDLWHEHDRQEARRELGIGEEKRFVIFFGARYMTDTRKGFAYLLESLKHLHERLGEDERREVLLLIAGSDIEEVKDRLLFDYRYVGYVGGADLPRLYSLADVFLSASVDDAGPSMVNQSLACGTPVVAFEMGTALDCVKGHNTGYCAALRDASDFASGIERLFRMPEEEYMQMRRDCRKLSEELFSPQHLISSVQEAYDRYRSK